MKKSRLPPLAGQLDAWLVCGHLAVGCTLLGLALLVLIWSWCRWAPKPASLTKLHLHQAVHCSATVLRKGPNDQGVGWNDAVARARVWL
jgi:cytochrome b561